MSNSTSFRLNQRSTLFGRLWASLDQMLLTYAVAMIRNGDISRCDI